MSQPKKKVSRGRRDRRRYSSGKGLEVVRGQTCPATGELVRSHGLPKDFAESSYYQARFEKKSAASSVKK